MGYMNLETALQNIGLTDKEARVYIALLQLGKTTSYAVAVRSNLKKPTVYVTLDNLVDKGAAQKIPRAKKALYVATPPEDLFDAAENKINNAKSVLPELKSLSKKGKAHKIGTAYYEGMAGIREMYRKMLKGTKESVGFYAHARDASKELQTYFDTELLEGVRRAGTKRRGITVADPTILEREYLDAKWAKEHSVFLKALNPKKYNSNISIEVFGNYTQIFSHRYLQATVIDNPDVADVMRQIFELVWERDDIVVAKTGLERVAP